MIKTYNRTATTIVVVAIVAAILLIDQVLKFYIKTNFCLGESVPIFGSWSYLVFTENPGMAFGWEFIDKMFLSLIRLVACLALIYYLYRLINSYASRGYIICIALIFVGAMGNLIDCMFYGMIFTESPTISWYAEQTPAQLVPWGEGYGEFLYGKVVDMFYFPIIDTTLPDWMPLVGGNDFVFFSPIFNVADTAISCSFILLLLFFRKQIIGKQ